MANRLVSTEITKWQGLNFLPGAEIPQNYLTDIVNFRINKDGSLQTRTGCSKAYDFTTVIATDPAHPGYTPGLGNINKVYDGFIDGNPVTIVIGSAAYAVYPRIPPVGHDYYAYAHPIYEGNFDSNVEVFEFNDVTYLIDGHTFYTFSKSDATNPYILQAANVYVPTIAITVPPSGGGEMYESINVMTDERRVLFSTVAGTQLYTLPETPGPRTLLANPIVKIVLDGTEIPSTGYALAGNTISLSTPPANDGINNLEVIYTCDHATYTEQQKDLPTSFRPVIFGGKYDTQIFYYEGNSIMADLAKRNIVYYSDIGENGSDPTYIPAENYVLINDATPITDMVRLYDRLIVFTRRATWYIGITEITLDEVTKHAYTVNSLHDNIGCAVPKTALLLNNVPAAPTDNGLYVWESTAVKDERNALCASDIVRDIIPWGDSDLKSFDDEFNKEAWYYLPFNSAHKYIAVFNYDIGVWYGFDITTGTDSGAIRGAVMSHGFPAIYTNSGLYVFYDGLDVDDYGDEATNTRIIASFHTRPNYFGRPEYTKNLYRYYITVKPSVASFVDDPDEKPYMGFIVWSDNAPYDNDDPYNSGVKQMYELTDAAEYARQNYSGFIFRRRCPLRRFSTIETEFSTNAPLLIKKIRFDAEITDDI